jgi:hypothetical protein
MCHAVVTRDPPNMGTNTINGKFLEGCDLSKFSIQHIVRRFCTIGSVIPPKRNYPKTAIMRKKNKLMTIVRKHIFQ